MKKLLFFFILFSFSFFSLAQNTYEKNLYANITKLNSANSSASLQQLTGEFAKLSGTKNVDWRVYYYAALSTVRSELLAQRQNKTQGIDIITAVAEKYLTPIRKEENTNSEINILFAQINYLKSLKQDSNKNLYIEKAQEYLAKAESMDSGNPRIDLIKGQIALTAQNKTIAKEYFENALQKLRSYNTKSKLDPSWGKDDTQYHLSLLK